MAAPEAFGRPGARRTAGQLPRDQKPKRGSWPAVCSSTRPFESLRRAGGFRKAWCTGGQPAAGAPDSKCGYIHSFVPYYGGITSETLVRPDLPFTSRIVLELHERLKNSVPGSQGYHFFTDRYYTSVTLAKELFKEKTHLTGTIMPNRKDNPPVIKHPKLMKGEIVAFRDENVMLLAWKDKRIVTMLSTWDTSETESVERRVRGGGKEIVLKPKVMTNYTKFMGGGGC
ncbi:hypothetical protein QTO34_010729 [Cnephaeus nilssonii]|uniref:PiggyBac transposable element-derived protein domain-containing protein n=1 Tax=Cnephaeus nilssonii TaxID=3371016 RepID=A0AA40LG23_CNENI|nr:hypothetical protein QTO34_010729 [Eptesicus nilssonii]